MRGRQVTKRKEAPDRRFARRLTAEQAAQVRADVGNGVTVSEIARRLGVARSSVQALLAGRTHRVQIPAEPVP
jgi:predicted transcriptional regulator